MVKTRTFVPKYVVSISDLHAAFCQESHPHILCFSQDTHPGPSHLTSGSEPGHPTRQQERHGPGLVLLVEWGKSHALWTPWVSHSDLEVERTKCAFPKMWGLRDTRVTAGSGPFCIVLHCPATPPRAWHGGCEAQRK